MEVTLRISGPDQDALIDVCRQHLDGAVTEKGTWRRAAANTRNIAEGIVVVATVVQGVAALVQLSDQLGKMVRRVRVLLTSTSEATLQIGDGKPLDLCSIGEDEILEAFLQAQARETRP